VEARPLARRLLLRCNAEIAKLSQSERRRDDSIQFHRPCYKGGLRSGGGQAAMAEVAFPLHEEEITALAHYLANL
jgi:hypothetical protein